MAVFNPDIPAARPPEWTNITRPISDLPGDKSKAMAITTAAQGLDTGVAVAENIDQELIKDKVRAGVSSLRDTTTLAYEQVRNSYLKGEQPDPQAARVANIPTLLPAGQDQPVPPGLQSGLDRANNIGTAMAQGGPKANDTLYTAALNSLAKQLRAEYPGHRDFVDEQIARISGKNPANAYMDNLLQDVSRLATASMSDKNKALNMGYQNIDMPGIMPYINAVKAGLPGAEDKMLNFLNTNLSKKYMYDEWERSRKAKADVTADDIPLAKQQFQSEVATAAYRSFKGVLQIPGLTDPATMERLLQDSQEGRIALSPEQHNMLLSAAVAAKNSFLNNAKDIANKRGYSTRINDPKAEQAIIENEAQRYDRLIDTIKNKDYGTLFEAQRRIEAQQTGTTQRLYDDPTMGNYWKTVQAVTKIGGPNWSNRLDAIGMQKGYLGDLQNFVTNTAKVASIPDDPRNPGQVKSMYDHLRQLQEEQARGGPVPQRAYKDVVQNVNLMVDPAANPAVKKEIAKYTFNPKNANVLDVFKLDFTDSQGKFHEGKYSVFDTLTQPKITNEIKNLNDTEVSTMYKNWAQDSFAKLYREDLAQLSKMGTNGVVPTRVIWDSQNNRFSVDDGKGRPIHPINPLDKPYVDEVQAVVNRINNGLYNLSNVHKMDGKDTSAYLLDLMVNKLQFTPNDNAQGFPEDMMRAILNSRKKETLKDAFEKAGK